MTTEPGARIIPEVKSESLSHISARDKNPNVQNILLFPTKRGTMSKAKRVTFQIPIKLSNPKSDSLAYRDCKSLAIKKTLPNIRGLGSIYNSNINERVSFI